MHLTYILCKISFISKFQLHDHIIGIIRSNYINFQEIICSYAANNF